MSLYQAMSFQIKGIYYGKIFNPNKILFKLTINIFFFGSCVSTFVSAVDEENIIF